MGAGLTPIPLVWASSGSADIENPETAEPGKTILGWVTDERPALEWENFTKNRAEVTINGITTYLNAGVPLTDLIDGTMNITNGDDTIVMSPAKLQFDDSNDSSQLVLKAGEGSSEKAIEYTSGDSSRVFEVDSIGSTVTEDAGTSYTLQTINAGRGLVYNGGPGAEAQRIRKTMYDASGITWAALGGVGTDANMWFSSGNIDLTGIPHNATTSVFFSVHFRWRRSGIEHIVPLAAEITNNAGVWQLTNSYFFGDSARDPDTGTDQEIIVTYDAIDVD